MLRVCAWSLLRGCHCDSGHVQKKATEWGEQLWIASLDVSDAFGNVDHLRLFGILRNRLGTRHALMLSQMLVGNILNIAYERRELEEVVMKRGFISTKS